MNRKSRFVGRANPEQQAESLREAIYIAVTSAAILLVETKHESVDLFEVATTLGLTALAIAVTMFIAHLVAHMVIHDQNPSKAQLRHTLRTSLTALLVAALPTIILLLGATFSWTQSATLTTAIIALVAGLAASVWLAVRGTTTQRLRRILLAGGLIVLALAALLIQILAHG